MIDPRALDHRLKALEAGTVPAGLMRFLTRTILAVTTDAAKGRYPGSGNPQNDTFAADDNVDATHPLNIRYIIPGNCQRVVSARLSFHLAAYRTYTSAANNPAVTSGSSSSASSGASSSTSSGASSTSTTGTGSHSHTTPVTNIASGGTPLVLYGSSVLAAVGDSAQVATSTDFGGPHSHGMDHTHGIAHNHDISHTHSVTSNVTLTNGVVEAATASGVTIAFDGVDRTAVLAGPWSADAVEIDVLKYVQQKADKTYHNIALTPAGLGRIEAHLRLGYFADVSIPA